MYTDNTTYDFLIVGAGLFGATFAQQATERGKRCLIIDRREHIGGNVYTKDVDGIQVHWYGAHIFHTNDQRVWEYINRFADFNRYTNSPLANYKGELYNLPFNMNTFYQLWKVKTPQEAQQRIQEQIAHLNIENPRNLEEQALKLVGTDIYEKLIKGYTEKQWGRKATELPAFIIKRLPVRFTFDNNYFSDRYQGIPTGGYTQLVARMLEGVEVRLGVDYFLDRVQWNTIAKQVVFTGQLDEFYEYRHGKLEYRSLRFEHEQLTMENYQGNAVVNYTEAKIPFTRIIEHKHFDFGTQSHTLITREYPQEWQQGSEPYYPVNDQRNTEVLKAYQALAEQETGVIFGGRLAEYRYYDMHQVIASALKKSDTVLRP